MFDTHREKAMENDSYVMYAGLYPLQYIHFHSLPSDDELSGHLLAAMAIRTGTERICRSRGVVFPANYDVTLLDNGST